jgi:hypothetical protein
LDSAEEIPLETLVETVNVPAVQLQRLNAPFALNHPRFISRTGSGTQLNSPFSVSKGSSVTELIKMMEQEIENDPSESSLNALITPCKGFDIELGKKITGELNVKRLVDDDKNTAWYRDHFYGQRK